MKKKGSMLKCLWTTRCLQYISFHTFSFWVSKLILLWILISKSFFFPFLFWCFLMYQNKRGGKVKLQSMLMPFSEFDHAEKGEALHGKFFIILETNATYWCSNLILKFSKSYDIFCYLLFLWHSILSLIMFAPFFIQQWSLRWPWKSWTMRNF